MSVENSEVTNNSNSHDYKMVNGNSDQHVNGMSNGHHNSDKNKSSSHKSSSKDKHRDKDRERSKDHKSSKSSHRDKDRDGEKHSSSNGNKDKHSSSSSSHKSSHKSKDRDRDKSEHKSSSSSGNKEHKSSDRDKERSDKDKSKSSSSSSKDKHSSSSGSKHKSKDKDRDRERERDKDKSSSSSKDKHKSSSSSSSKHKSKDKDRDREKDKHKSSSSSSNKEKSSSSHKNSIDSEPIIKNEPDIKEEMQSPIREFSINCERLDISQNSSCDYSLSQFKDEESSLPPPVKFENDSESDNNFIECKAEQDDDASYENEAAEEEDDSEEDIPLSKRKKADTDSEDDAPLSARKKPKTEKKNKRVKNESDDDDDDESDYGKTKKKKVKRESAATPVKKSTAAAKKVKNEPESPTKKGKKKKEEEEQEVWKWWEEEKRNDGTKWSFLEHKGPVFAPEYEPLPDSVIFEYEGKRMKLSEPSEEIAGFYARMLDHEYTSKKVFNDNFFKDWRKIMNKKEKEIITDLHKCNFNYMNEYFKEQSEKNRNRTKEEKLAIKEKNEALQKEYGIAIIDGHKEKIGNFRIEPPGLFRGRGDHPKMGMLKKRVMPEDIIINCSKNSKIPVPPKGHRWKEVRHDNTVTWLASWTENVQNQVKYIMLNPSSKIKGEKDYAKYETARRLKAKIDKIRETYTAEFKSKEMRIRQRAVALYFIDKLALRAGNEKDEDQADTVGCCSLRCEHVTLQDEASREDQERFQNENKENVIIFDFLGKDSIRYYNEVVVEKRVYKNLQLFKENKKPDDDLFDRLNTAMLNEHLKELMEGLTAKVFRTYNASITLQRQLDELTDENMSVPEKLLAYNRANRAVAILCNHQRAVPKTHDKSMENLREKIRAKREQIKEVTRELKDIKKGSAKGSIDKEKKKKQLDRLKEQLTKLEIQETDRDENKTIALGTSKLNYLDPRISVAWCKKHGVPIEKIFNKTQRDKFRWAIEMADETYSF
ncbi:hypothetical protein PVAND_000782 [Polypedilum vanderplanki]|uniref:DNA topoisomerase I n=1 Tax=Polypedilum vanderplanki TaxID=319348 RepID=A0A9J6BKZ4_POLVA|nr:hypothetical protein PVAND_000782 [Polypedilum vanderplanki]